MKEEAKLFWEKNQLEKFNGVQSNGNGQYNEQEGEDYGDIN